MPTAAETLPVAHRLAEIAAPRLLAARPRSTRHMRAAAILAICFN